jgi:nucleolar protein 56
MKCFIADTLIGIFAFDENGNILNFIDFDGNIQKIVEFFHLLELNNLTPEYKDFLEKLKNSGFDEFLFDNKKLENATKEKLGYQTNFLRSSLELKNFRFNLEKQVAKIGLSLSREEISRKFKEVNEQLIKKQVSQLGSQIDIIIIQIIETLDIIKKSISLFSGRLREWYGLYFPELTDRIIEDNILLSELVVKIGRRENYTKENIDKNFTLKDEFKIMLIEEASKSMGAEFDLAFVQKYANQILSLDSYRLELENHLNDLMIKLAPNLNTIVGPLVGAKLIAKAGSLKQLAYMPASRIQLLGAEKALFRFLKTGDRRPKHGLIFQWKQIRSSKIWLRGKISRIIAAKIGLASKIDYFNGEFMGDFLLKDIEEKIKNIEEKYPLPPKKSEIKIEIPKKKKPRRRKKKGKWEKKNE